MAECHASIKSRGVRVDFCGLGARWKKSTRLRGTLRGLETVSRVCKGGKGKDVSGRFRTLVAQPYPQPLCAALALLVSTAMADGSGVADATE